MGFRYEGESINLVVQYGTYENFIELFKEGDQYKIDERGNNLLCAALANFDAVEKYKIAIFLINKGADVTIINKDNNSLFSTLFAYGLKDVTKTTILCKILLEKGANITVLDRKDKTTMFKYVFSLYWKIPEMEMIPLYDLIFSQEGLRLLKKDKWGLTVLDFARKGEDRPIGVKYMED